MKCKFGSAAGHRGASQRSRLFSVKSSGENSFRAEPVSLASELAQRVRQRAANEVRSLSTPYIFKLSDARHLAFLLLMKSVFGRGFPWAMNVTNVFCNFLIFITHNSLL